MAKVAFINDAKRREPEEGDARPENSLGREGRPRRACSRRATVDQRLIKFWRDRSSRALPALCRFTNRFHAGFDTVPYRTPFSIAQTDGRINRLIASRAIPANGENSQIRDFTWSSKTR